MRYRLVSCSVVLLLVGCSTLTTHLEPKVDLARLKHVFVQSNLNDNHGLDLMIVRELQTRGLKAESGPMTLMPFGADAYLTYQDQWEWDFRDSLISLGLTLRDARTDRPLASAVYIRPTAFLKTPSVMVQMAVAGLFDQKPGRSSPGIEPAQPPEDRHGRGSTRGD